MKECLIDVLNGRDTLLHVFPIAMENQDGTPKTINPEIEALELAVLMQLVPEVEVGALHARPHVSRGVQLTPYSDIVEIKHKAQAMIERHICERAYFLWQQEGCSENRADEHWHRACEIESRGGVA